MFKYLWVIFLIGCGDANDQKAVPQDVQDTAQKTDEAPEEDGTPGDVARVISYSFDSKGDLPECDKSYENALAYIEDMRKFFTCKKKVWKELDIVVGEQDADTAGDGNMFLWVDPVTGKSWLRFTDKARTEVDAQTLCTSVFSSEFRMPLSAEISEADEDGMFIGMTGNLIYAWAVREGANNMYNSVANIMGINGITPTGMALCIEK